MDPSEAVVLAESCPIRRMNKLILYGNVRTSTLRLTCSVKIMHVKR